MISSRVSTVKRWSAFAPADILKYQGMHLMIWSLIPQALEDKANTIADALTRVGKTLSGNKGEASSLVSMHSALAHSQNINIKRFALSRFFDE